MVREAWSATVHGVAKSRTQLSNWACMHDHWLNFTWLFIYKVCITFKWLLTLKVLIWLGFTVKIHTLFNRVFQRCEGVVWTLPKRGHRIKVCFQVLLLLYFWRWRITGTGGLPSLVSHRVGHGCATSLSLSTFMHWRRKWQPTPVFLPGESQGRVGCRLWGRTESDTTEAT